MKIVSHVVVFLMGCGLCNDLIAQEVRNAHIEQQKNDLVITFDLIPNQSLEEIYKLSLTAHFENGDSIPLTSERHHDMEVTAGKGIRIIINGSEVLKDFKGEVDFSIGVEQVYTPIYFLNPVANSDQRRGKDLEVNWEGGYAEDSYSLHLKAADSSSSVIYHEVRSGSYSWSVPRTTKKGMYRLNLISQTHPSERVLSPEFKIKSKIPLVVKLIPAVIIGGVVAALLYDPNDQKEEEFPSPPALPEL